MNIVNGNKHIARKRFGQHFLKDAQILQRIVTAFAPRNDQNLVEIGPGLGALTTALLERINRLTVIEVDRDLAAFLRGQFTPDKLTVLEMDILKCDLSGIKRLHPDKPLRLIGNLPYNISTPLIFHLLKQVDLLEDMMFMLQREVALRLTAKPGNKNYGRLTVMTSLELDCECLIDVPPTAFDPPPKVESTVVHLRPKTSQNANFDRNHLNQLVTAAFGQRRKTLRNSLENLVTGSQFKAANVDSSLRAESLSLQAYIRLSNACLN